MGTCVSKCYPSPPDSKPPAAAALATAGAASPCPTTTTTSSSLSLASTWNNSASSATSSAALLLLTNSNGNGNGSSKSKSGREWDVVVLDPNKSDDYQCHRSKLPSCVHHPTSGSLPKRARSVSPLPLTTRRPSNKVQQHKRQKPSNKTKGAAPAPAQDDLTNPVIAMDCFIFL